MRYFILSSCLLILLSCNKAYKNLHQTTGDISVLQKFKLSASVALYNTQVEVKIGGNLSGLMLIKKMPDSSTRIVFASQMGLNFFDFGFNADGSFKVYSILKQMNRKPVIKTLRKDFDLILMRGLDSNRVSIRKNDSLTYYIFKQTKGYYTYVTNNTGTELVSMEISSKRKPVVKAIMKNYIDGVPDTISISHQNFKFNIGLKRIER
ncbi:MAG TPA: hypothetical protein VK718_07395 [Ferruginibacter sp.]|jgi:hypothetical protein|nr:hypothetical protein [Ferruginibacter sp.]